MTTQKSKPKIDPLLKKERLNTRIPQWLIDWMNKQDIPQSKLIEHALTEQYDLVAPVIPLKIKR